MTDKDFADLHFFFENLEKIFDKTDIGFFESFASSIHLYAIITHEVITLVARNGNKIIFVPVNS